MSDTEDTSENQERDAHGRLLPGHTANPNGRPKKGTSITELLNKYLDDCNDGDTVTRKERLIQKMYEKADQDCYFPAQKYIIDRIDGEPVKTQEISGPEGEPLSIRVEFVGEDKSSISTSS